MHAPLRTASWHQLCVACTAGQAQRTLVQVVAACELLPLHLFSCAIRLSQWGQNQSIVLGTGYRR